MTERNHATPSTFGQVNLHLSEEESAALAARVIDALVAGLTTAFTPAEVRYIAAHWCHAASADCAGCRQSAIDVLHAAAHRAAHAMEVH
jgi:hypothetical protein